MRDPSDVTDLVRRLEGWRDARAKINQRPDRHGRALPNRELDEAILYLGEYREACEVYEA